MRELHKILQLRGVHLLGRPVSQRAATISVLSLVSPNSQPPLTHRHLYWCHGFYGAIYSSDAVNTTRKPCSIYSSCGMSLQRLYRIGCLLPITSVIQIEQLVLVVCLCVSIITYERNGHASSPRLRSFSFCGQSSRGHRRKMLINCSVLPRLRAF